MQDMERDKLVQEYRARLPERVDVRIEGSDEGLSARISTPDGKISHCYTQAGGAVELVPMINDAIQTYFEIPDEFRSAVGYYAPLSETHIRLEEMFNQLVSLEKQANQQGESQTTLTLRDAELQVC